MQACLIHKAVCHIVKQMVHICVPLNRYQYEHVQCSTCTTLDGTDLFHSFTLEVTVSKRLCSSCKGKNINGRFTGRNSCHFATWKVVANSSLLTTLFEVDHGTSYCNLIYLQTIYKLESKKLLLSRNSQCLNISSLILDKTSCLATPNWFKVRLPDFVDTCCCFFLY